MKYGLIGSLITLYATTLLGHSNFLTITTNVNPFDINSSYIKADNQSFFNTFDNEHFILNVAATRYLKYVQGDLGMGYRKFFNKFGLGLNLFCSGMNEPKVIIGQISPGIEFFYDRFQVTYNYYLPASTEKLTKSALIQHCPISEVGVSFSPTNWFNVGFLPFYEHTSHNVGINSNVSVAIAHQVGFSVSPFLNRRSKGLVLSFGFGFGGKRCSHTGSFHRSNQFVYQVGPLPPEKVYELPGNMALDPGAVH